MNALQIGLCWGTLQRASLVALIEAAGRHGFPTLSIRPDAVDAALAEGETEAGLRRRLGDAGVRVRVIDALSRGLPGMPDHIEIDGVRALRADEAACFRAAEIVGAPIVNIALFGGAPASPEALAEAVHGVAHRAATRALSLVVEFIPDTPVPSLGAAAELVAAVAEPNFGILLDSWHLARSGGTIEQVRALPAEAIGALQLSDRVPPPPGAAYVPMAGRLLPGQGALPLHALVAAACANQPALTAEIEVFDDELRALPVDAAAAWVAVAVAAWRAAA